MILKIIGAKYFDDMLVGYVSKLTNTYLWLGDLISLSDQEYSSIERILIDSETVEDAYHRIMDKFNLKTLAIADIYIDGKLYYIISPRLSISVNNNAIHNNSEEYIYNVLTVEPGDNITLYQHKDNESASKVMKYLDLSGISVSV